MSISFTRKKKNQLCHIFTHYFTHTLKLSLSDKLKDIVSCSLISIINLPCFSGWKPPYVKPIIIKFYLWWWFNLKISVYTVIQGNKKAQRHSFLWRNSGVIFKIPNGHRQLKMSTICCTFAPCVKGFWPYITLVTFSNITDVFKRGPSEPKKHPGK